MRRFRAIIQTNKEPEDKEVLWYFKKKLLYFDGGWKPFNPMSAGDIAFNNDKASSVEEALIYLFDTTRTFLIVDTLNDLYTIDSDILQKGLIVYVKEDSKEYQYNGSGWVLYEKTSRSEVTKIFTSKAAVLESDIETRTIEIDTPIFNSTSIIGYRINDDLSSGVYSEIEEFGSSSTVLVLKEGTIMPDVGEYVYNIGDTQDLAKQLILAVHISSGVPVLSQFKNTSITPWNNLVLRFGLTNDYSAAITNGYFQGTFVNEEGRQLSDILQEHKEFIDSQLEINENVSNTIEELRDVDADMHSKVSANTKNISLTKELLDAKVIEVGGVPFDYTPTKDSTNAITSGGVYDYIQNKFIVISEDEYEAMNKADIDSETFYYIYESI